MHYRLHLDNKLAAFGLHNSSYLLLIKFLLKEQAHQGLLNLFFMRAP